MVFLTTLPLLFGSYVWNFWGFEDIRFVFGCVLWFRRCLNWVFWVIGVILLIFGFSRNEQVFVCSPCSITSKFAFIVESMPIYPRHYYTPPVIHLQSRYGILISLLLHLRTGFWVKAPQSRLWFTCWGSFYVPDSSSFSKIFEVIRSICEFFQLFPPQDFKWVSFFTTTQFTFFGTHRAQFHSSLIAFCR